MDLPKKQMVVACKWIFKKKKGTPMIEEPSYKVRLVTKSFTQVEGVNYYKIFSSVVKYCSIRVLMTIVNQYNHELKYMDANTVF